MKFDSYNSMQMCVFAQHKSDVFEKSFLLGKEKDISTPKHIFYLCIHYGILHRKFDAYNFCGIPATHKKEIKL